MSSSQPHILIIDDNEEILQSVSIMLTRKSFKVSIKNKVTDIELEVGSLLPDLILLDNNLGWGDGCLLCKSLKANADLRHIRVIMFSAYYKKKDECIKAGADNFIEKPFEMKALLNMISLLQ